MLLLTVLGCSLFAKPRSAPLEDWKLRAAELRQLSFETPVGFEWIERERMRALVRDEIESRYSSEFVMQYRDAYAALGVLPPDIDLLKTFLDLNAAELAGLYSPRVRTMYVVEDIEVNDPGQASLTVVHELVHALQHQHFPQTMLILQELRHNDDLTTAVSAVLEGDASFTMLGATTNASFGRSIETAEHVQKMWLERQDHTDGVLGQTPRLLRSSLFFPYAYGTVGAARSYERAGNAGLDEWLENPPLSTMQLMYPDDRDPITFVKLPVRGLGRRIAKRGCKVGHHNVAGAVTIEVLFEEHDGMRVDSLLPQWNGDRFLQIRCGEKSELFWISVWDDVHAAKQFASAYREIADSVVSKHHLAGRPRVMQDREKVWIYTPGLAGDLEWIQRRAEFRVIPSLDAWRAAGCFPESPCPVSPQPALPSTATRP